MDKVRRYAVYLLVIAGCGGLLFDFGGTIIGPALPYIGPVDENPGSLGLFTTSQIAHLSSAVVMCAALACLVAGWLAERFGRKFMMLASAAIAALACLPICMADGSFVMFFVGRAMQGVSAGLIGVVVPMYLAECLDANSRGKGAGMFQLLDFVGITFCSLVGLVVVHAIGAADDVSVSAASKSLAWKTIFWSSAAPAVLFFLGALGLRESPRWLYKRGLSLMRTSQQRLASAEAMKSEEGPLYGGIINSLEREAARAKEKAEDFFKLGYYSLAANNGETKAKEILAEMVAADKAEAAERTALTAAAKGDSLFQRKYVLPFCISLAILICNQAIGFNAIQYFSIPMFMKAGLSQAVANAANLAVWLVPIPVTVVALWLVDRSGRKTLLKAGTIGMVAALIGVATVFLLLEKGIVSTGSFAGWTTVTGIALFVASFSIGPGVVVWLALSELMPGRIRANGMAIALFVNQMVAFAIADAFLPWQKACGYAVVFYSLAFFAFLYFLAAAFLLPETKGKTLEEIERSFSHRN
ncbi:MAG: MFS transporter [Kiritimatiellae bacterium]|nr:MFS transporter [Kiritimatiellia bacterium]